MADVHPKPPLSFRQAAEQVLLEAGAPLRPSDIFARAAQRGLLTTSGKTPAATMAAQLYTEIQQHGEASTFIKVGRGTFGLRAWGSTGTPKSKRPVASLGRVSSIVTDPLERLAAEVMTAQHESYNSTRFERVLAEAFSALGYDAQHVGGAGRTDILLNASVSAASYRVVVDAKSNKHGKIGDQNIDWNSLDDHRKAESADYAMVVAPDFSGGNLLKRANDYGVALLTGAALAELLRLHRRTPFSLSDLRPLFETQGKTGEVVEELRQTARATERRWTLLRELMEVIEQLPRGVFADAQKLWLLLSFQQKEAAPSLEAVEDALSVLSSRVLGVLKAVNGGQEYALTMTPATAMARLRALADAMLPAGRAPSEPTDAAPAGLPTLAHVSRPPEPPQPVRLPADPLSQFAELQSEIVRQLESLGATDPQVVSKRHVTLKHGDRTVGLAFRASRCYPGPKWWWTFTKSADANALAGCDVIILVGLMADPGDDAGVRDAVMYVTWDEAVATASKGNATAWTAHGRMHVYAGNGGPWEHWVRRLSELQVPLPRHA